MAAVRWKEVDRFEIYCRLSVKSGGDGPGEETKSEGDVMHDQANQYL